MLPVTGPDDGLGRPVRRAGGVGGELLAELPHLAPVTRQLITHTLAGPGAGVERPLELEQDGGNTRTLTVTIP